MSADERSRPGIRPGPASAPAETADEGRRCPPDPDADRLRRLFRHTIARGEVQPLLHLLPRYRRETP